MAEEPKYYDLHVTADEVQFLFDLLHFLSGDKVESRRRLGEALRFRLARHEGVTDGSPVRDLQGHIYCQPERQESR